MQAEKRPGKLRKKESVLPYTKTNWLLFLVGLVFLIVGYIALGVKPWNSFTSLNIAPILLVLGYCVIFPIAILYHKKEKKLTSNNSITVSGKIEQPSDSNK
jgi:positive regulator of sigma E activity